MIVEFDLFPVFYFTNHQAVIGPGTMEVMPEHLNRLDFELEAAIVIGKEGRTAQSMRTILTAVSTKLGRRAHLDIVD